MLPIHRWVSHVRRSLQRVPEGFGLQKALNFSKIRNIQEDQFLRCVSYGSCAEHICQARIIYYEKQY